jgi:hypothetical protein
MFHFVLWEMIYEDFFIEEVLCLFKGSKYKPLDLRVKSTRAIRRMMTPKQASAMTLIAIIGPDLAPRKRKK